MLTDPLRASYDIWNSNKRNLAANGALMRTGVVGAPFFWDERKVVENSMMAAKVTHADPRYDKTRAHCNVTLQKK